MLDALVFVLQKKVKQLATKLDSYLHSTTGHKHTGVNGDAPKLDPTKSLTYVPLNTAGGTVTGELKLTGEKQLSVNGWGVMSAGNSGQVLIGQNCYIEKSTGKFKYQNTGTNIGARGILYKYDNATNSAQPWFFDTGILATVADGEFTPVLRKIWHEGNLVVDSFAKKTGDTYTGIHNMSGGRFVLPVGTDKWAN